jgi:hypothetical protein
MFEACRVFDVAKLGISMRCPRRLRQQKQQQGQNGSHATILQDFSGAST